MLRDLLAKAFPNGMPEVDEVTKKQRNAKSLVRFLEQMGYRLVRADTKERTAEFSIFIGDPVRKKGLEMRWGCSVDFLSSASRRELVESLLAYITGSYTDAVLEVEANGFPDSPRGHRRN